MDIKRIYRRLLEQKYTDLELVIIDANQRLKLNLHKIILIFLSPFFDKLLEYNDEKSLEINNDKKSLEIKVDNADVTRDCIYSLYGHPIIYFSWSYILAMAKCQDYFGVEIIVHEIPAVISPEDYDYVLEYYSMTGFDAVNLKILFDNLPVDYNVEKLSQDLVLQMAKYCAPFTMMKITDSKNIDIGDPATNTVIHTIKTDINIKTLCYSRNKRFIVAMDDTEINIYDGIDYEYLTTFKNNKDSRIKLTFNDTVIAIANGEDNSVKLYDLMDPTKMKKIIEDSTTEFKFIMYSNTASYLVCCYENNQIQLLETNTYKVIKTITIEKDSYVDMKWSKDDAYAAIEIQPYQNMPYIALWHIPTNQILDIGKIMDLSFISFSKKSRQSNKKYAAIENMDNINIVDLDTQSTICTLTETCTKIMFLPLDNYVVMFGPNIIKDIRTNEVYLNFDKVEDIVSSVDGKYLAVRNIREINLWDFHEKKIMYTIPCPERPDMLFSPDNKMFAIGVDSSIIYDMSNGRHLQRINGVGVNRLFEQRFYDDKLKKLTKNIDKNKLLELL